MPIVVDRDERRRQIVAAATQELSELGISSFTLRGVGRRLGGSVTMVTHYFASRDELFRAILADLLEEAQLELDELKNVPDPRQRLKEVLDFFVPDTPASALAERARVALSSHAASDPLIGELFEKLEPAMRDVVRAGLHGYVPLEHEERATDFVRLWSGGLALSIVEHPDLWTASRQRASKSLLLKALASLRHE